MLDLLSNQSLNGAYPNSYYAAVTKPLNLQPKYENNEHFDVCIIGAGFTGLSSAWHLAEKGYKVCVLEAQRVGFGASGRNGGQVGSGQRLDLLELEAHFGSQLAADLFNIGSDAVRLVKQICNNPIVNAQFNHGIVEAIHKRRYIEDAKRNMDAYQKYNYPHVKWLERDEMRAIVNSSNYLCGTLDEFAGHVNPLELAVGLAKLALNAGTSIFEMSKVVRTSFENSSRKYTINLENNSQVRADYLVFACNGYLGDINSQISNHIFPINNFIVATKQLSDAQRDAIISKPVAVCDSRFVVNYFRFSNDNRLLFGGGETYSYKFPDDITKLVRKPLRKVFPQLANVEIDYEWGGTLAITQNRMPLFFHNNNAISASGFSGHGVALATFAGKLISELVAGKSTKFEIMQKASPPKIPFSRSVRSPLLKLAMMWYRLRDMI